MRSSAFLLLLLAAACSASRPPATETGRGLRVQALPPRMLVAKEPQAAHQALGRFLDSHGPAVRERGDGSAIVRERWGGVRLKWAAETDRLLVQAVDLYDGYRGEPAGLIAALAYHLDVAGIRHSTGFWSGCRLPATLAGAEDFWEALTAVFTERGLAWIDYEIGQNFNQQLFGTADGEPTWHVDVHWEYLATPDRIEFFNDAMPFDGAGEEELLLEFLGRLTTRDISLYR